MTAILFLLRAIILVLLWAFVLAAIVSVRQDIFGTRKATRRPATPRPTPAPPPRPAPAAAPSGRRDRGVPRRLGVTARPRRTAAAGRHRRHAAGHDRSPLGCPDHHRPRRRLDTGPDRRLRLHPAR